MYIAAIGSNYGSNHKYSQKNFTGLIKDKSVEHIINNMSKNDILELKKIEKRLSRTKFWDMKISNINKMFNEFKFEFIDKKNQHVTITDGIHPYDKQDNTIKVYSIIYGDKNISQNIVETLRYKSSARADAVYNKYLKNMDELRHRGFNQSPIESIKSKEIELNMLEEASHFAAKEDKLKYVTTDLKTKNTIGNFF